MAAVLAAGVIGAALSAAVSSPAGATPDEPQILTKQCTSADKAHYKHTFAVDLVNRTSTATIEVHGKTLCAGQSQDFALVSYITKSSGFELPQYLFDSKVGTLNHNTAAISLTVKIPACYTQVDFVFGKEVLPLDANGDLYGNRKVGSDSGIGARSQAKSTSQRTRGWYNGGNACPDPSADVTHACDGSSQVSLQTNPNRYADTTFLIARGQWNKTVVVKRTDALTKVDVPAGTGDITVKRDGVLVKTFKWQEPANCEKPTVSWESDCNDLIITIKNPAGNRPIEVLIDTVEDAQALAVAKVEAAASAPFTVAAGETKIVKIKGVTGLVATVTIGDGESKLATYLKPVTCGGTGGGLPTTGPKAGLMAGAGLVLVTAGVGLFMIRRRRVTFVSE